MNRILAFTLIAVFSVFVGSQITEGCLLLPYWKSLSPAQFYDYYSKFGSTIGQFYTILTIIAAIIPITVSAYCLIKKSKALSYAVISTCCAIIFVASFYVYFKGANQQFLDASLTGDQLQSELIIWGNWHWGRIVFEILSLSFLMLALKRIATERVQ